ncbi:prevent-host-death protein [Sphaerisporangium sp. NPDC049002]|uniref:type II toxin-antitoxin system Phd/YefM family antitoxin n=1 Tax=Sphaerisporangium sp. NPDC049002 TaxID=3155392 RepID=UPI00340EDFBF
MTYPAPELPEINQRDLKNRASEIMDAIEHGESFTLMRNGRQIATVTPIGRRRTFVPRERVDVVFAGAPAIDDKKFREDVRAIFDDVNDDPYDRARRQGRSPAAAGEELS